MKPCLASVVAVLTTAMGSLAPGGASAAAVRRASAQPLDLLVAEGALWESRLVVPAGNQEAPLANVRRLDPTTLRPAGPTVPLAFPGGLLAGGAGRVWVNTPTRVVGLDPRTGQPAVRTGGSSDTGAAAPAVASGRVWAIDRFRQRLVSPSTRPDPRVLSVRLPQAAVALATGPGAIWVALLGPVRHTPGGGQARGPGSVLRVDARTGHVRSRTAVGLNPKAIATGLGLTWVVNASDSTITRIAGSGRRVGEPAWFGEPIPGPAPGVDAAFGRGRIWAISGALGGLVATLTPGADTPTVGRVPLGKSEALVALAAGPVGAYVAIGGPKPRICRLSDDIQVVRCRRL